MIWPLLAPLWFADAVVLGHKCCAHGCLAAEMDACLRFLGVR